MSTGIVAIDHVQLAMPPGREAEARDFYDRLLGIPEVGKPADAPQRGGAWFESNGVKVHLGIEPDFRPSAKAHPAFVVRGLGALLERLRAAGVPVVESPMAGYFRVHVKDPFGNRIELMEPDDSRV